MESRGMVTQLQRFSLHDGPGIRTTVFLKGCNLHCPWCHNPETQNPQPEEMYFPELCVHCGHCEEGCTTGARVLCGTGYTPEELAAALLRDMPFYGADGGVTFSGGEPLLQADFVKATEEILAAGKVRTAIDTALCVPFEHWKGLPASTDLFLVDVKILSPEKSRSVTGADPSLLADNLRRLQAEKKEVWIRIPTLPGVNDTEEEISLAAALLKPMDNVTEIRTLPVFGHGRRKARALGRVPDERWFSPDADRAASEHARRLGSLLGKKVSFGK